LQNIRKNKRTQIADVRYVVNSGPARINSRFFVLERNKFFFLTGESIKEFYHERVSLFSKGRLRGIFKNQPSASWRTSFIKRGMLCCHFRIAKKKAQVDFVSSNLYYF
jgi:hypothetical protein